MTFVLYLFLQLYLHLVHFLLIIKFWTKNNNKKKELLVGVVSLSVFGGNFVLAKVRLGLVSVRCSELRGVRFSEVRNILVLW